MSYFSDTQPHEDRLHPKAHTRFQIIQDANVALGDVHAFSIRLAPGQAKWCAVYNSQRVSGLTHDFYGISVPVELLEDRGIPSEFIHRPSRSNMVNLKSRKKPPRVFVQSSFPCTSQQDQWAYGNQRQKTNDTQDLEWMVMGQQHMQVQNQTADTWLEQQQLLLECEATRAGSLPTFHKYPVSADRRFLSLVSVTVIRP